MKKIIKITACILIQAIFFLELGWAKGEVFYIQKENTALLSPSVQLKTG